MDTFLQLGWQVQIIVILCLTFILWIVAVDDEAGGNLLQFIGGMKRLVAKKPGKQNTLVYRLVELIRRLFVNDQHKD